MAPYRVLSSDSHVVEPPDLWTSRMDPSLGDRIPHLVAGEPFDFWYIGQQHLGVLGTSGAYTGARFERPGEILREAKFADVRPGGYDPHAHVEDITMDGVDGNVVYPSMALEMFALQDQPLLRDIFRAYNDWLSGFCSAYPNKLKGIALLLLDENVDAGIQELHQIATSNAAGALISVYPSPGQSYDQPMYEPFWAAAQEVGLPLSLHVSTNRPDSGARNLINQGGSARVTVDYWVRVSLCHLVFSGVFERFPDLTFVQAEHDIAWLPYFLRRLDTTYIERTTQTPYRYQGDTLPSDFMRSNVFHSFQEDDVGIQLRHLIGVDNLLWGSDYPHAESTFPRSREIISRILDGVPEDEQAKIAGANTARIYGFA